MRMVTLSLFQTLILILMRKISSLMINSQMIFLIPHHLMMVKTMMDFLGTKDQMLMTDFLGTKDQMMMTDFLGTKVQMLMTDFLGTKDQMLMTDFLGTRDQ